MLSKNFSYTSVDIENAFNLHYSKKYPIRSKLMLLLGAILILTFLILLVVPSFNQVFSNFKWLFLIMGIFYIAFYFYRKKSMVKMAMKNPTIKDMTGFDLTKETLKLIGKNGQSDVPLGKINEIFYNEHSILLYFTKDNFFIIPKRLFTNEEENLFLKAFSSNAK